MSRPSKPKAAPAVAAPEPPHPAAPRQPDPTGADSAPAPVSAAPAAVAAPAPVDPHLPTGPGASPDGTAPSPNAPNDLKGVSYQPDISKLDLPVVLSFVGPDEPGSRVSIVSAVLIDGTEVREGDVIVPPAMADDLVRAGAATRAPKAPAPDGTPDPDDTPAPDETAPDTPADYVATAAEAASAPVVAISPVTPPPVPTAGMLIVKGPARGRWRAGRHFGPEPVEIAVADLSDAGIALLEGDPLLTLTWSAVEA